MDADQVAQSLDFLKLVNRVLDVIDFDDDLGDDQIQRPRGQAPQLEAPLGTPHRQVVQEEVGDGIPRVAVDHGAAKDNNRLLFNCHRCPSDYVVMRMCIHRIMERPCSTR